MKYFIDTVVREYFEDAEEREHWIKEHSDAPFDAKRELLDTGKYTKEIPAEESLDGVPRVIDMCLVQED